MVDERVLRSFPPKKYPTIYCGFTVVAYDRDGGCPEHPAAGAFLTKDYQYEYPDGSTLKMSMGWICAGCLRRGWAWDGNQKISVEPIKGKDRRRVTAR